MAVLGPTREAVHDHVPGQLSLAGRGMRDQNTPAHGKDACGASHGTFGLLRRVYHERPEGGARPARNILLFFPAGSRSIELFLGAFRPVVERKSLRFQAFNVRSPWMEATIKCFRQRISTCMLLEHLGA